MFVRFWGIRRSFVAPISSADLEAKIRKVLELATPADILSQEGIEGFIDLLPFSLRGTYGGNTICVQLVTDEGNQIIIDAGTGLHKLGMHFLKSGRMNGEEGNNKIGFMLTHFHWDHVKDLMFFPAALNPNNHFYFFSSFKDIKSQLSYEPNESHFPLSFNEQFLAQKEFYYLPEGDWKSFFDVDVMSKASRRPEGCYAYKFRNKKGRVLVFCFHIEFNLEDTREIDSYIEYFQGADLLVLNAQYILSDSLEKNKESGYSSLELICEMGIKSGVRRLIILQHDSNSNDEEMDAIRLEALRFRDKRTSKIDIEILTAYEGLEVIV